MDEFIKIVSHDKLNALIPQIIALGKDPLGIVRSHVGGVISNMVGYVPKDQAYQSIQPMIKDLMKDDSQEVRKGYFFILYLEESLLLLNLSKQWDQIHSALSQLT